jgi:flagellar basal-body rod modification protein FlgD
MASPGANASDSNTASTISSDDFLTLLVTELKNQDPTANSDPNQYVNQLVQVNSLEQLIQINETLTNNLGSGSAQSEYSAVTGSTGMHSVPQIAVNAVAERASQRFSVGNLSAPTENPAARRIAQALGSSALRN